MMTLHLRFNAQFRYIYTLCCTSHPQQRVKHRKKHTAANLLLFLPVASNLPEPGAGSSSWRMRRQFLNDAFGLFTRPRLVRQHGATNGDHELMASLDVRRDPERRTPHVDRYTKHHQHLSENNLQLLRMSRDHSRTQPFRAPPDTTCRNSQLGL